MTHARLPRYRFRDDPSVNKTPLVLSGYVPMGDVTSADFNSTKYPGICKPSNFATLDKFKELQRQLNRYAYACNISDRVADDGDIGPGTIALLGKCVRVNSLPSLVVPPSSCTTVALAAESITADMKAFADGKGAPAKVSGPASVRLPVLVNATTGKETVAPPDFIRKMFGRDLSTTEKLAFVGVAGGVGYLLLTRKKGKRRK